jgi:hypothetical protein
MLTHDQQEKLIANWGEPADSLHCNAIVRFYDPRSEWFCYIYAMDPWDMDTILCLIKGFNFGIEIWKLSHLSKLINDLGDPPRIDEDFRPKKVTTLLKQYKEVI